MHNRIEFTLKKNSLISPGTPFQHNGMSIVDGRGDGLRPDCKFKIINLYSFLNCFHLFFNVFFFSTFMPEINEVIKRRYILQIKFSHINFMCFIMVY
jgi:hypothetical protein